MYSTTYKEDYTRTQRRNKLIIPRTRVGYELLDSGRGAEHRIGYNKLISNKREWNNCFIKYQTLDFVYVKVRVNIATVYYY